MRLLAEPCLWAADGSLLQDVAELSSGFCLLSPELEKLQGKRLKAQLRRLEESSGPESLRDQ